MRRSAPFARTLVIATAVTLSVVPGLGRQAPSAPTPTQQPTPPPNPDVLLSANLVTLTVVVRDAAGRLVPDLESQDFTIYEDGKRREMDRFYRHGEVPLRLVVLFDTSVSVRDRIDFERRAAARFFTRAVRPGDRAALYGFSSKLRKVTPLTDSTEVLARATETLQISGLTALYEAIEKTSKALDDAVGRRVIVLLSDGHDTVRPEWLSRALVAAQAANVMIYAISPAGADTDQTPVGRAGASALRRLAAETGGTAFFPPVRTSRDAEATDLDDIFGTIVDELRAHYTMTYYSEAPRDDERLHELRVEVRRPGLTVSARRGFYSRRAVGD